VSESTGTMVISELERRLQRLEDIEAIKNLKARYAELCDQNYNPNELVKLFTDDAVWEGSPFGVFHGKAEIKRFFASASSQIPWAFHLMIGPEIAVDSSGMAATGRWYLFEPCTMTDREGVSAEEPVIQMAKYEDAYRKEGGEWKFEHVRIKYEAITPLHQGWVARRFRS